MQDFFPPVSFSSTCLGVIIVKPICLRLRYIWGLTYEGCVVLWFCLSYCCVLLLIVSKWLLCASFTASHFSEQLLKFWCTEKSLQMQSNQLHEANGINTCGLINEKRYMEAEWKPLCPELRMAQKSMGEARGIHHVTGWLLMFTHIEHHVSLLRLSLEFHIHMQSQAHKIWEGPSMPPLTVSSWEGSMSEHCVTIF